MSASGTLQNSMKVQSGFINTLMSLFKQRFAGQDAILNFLTDTARSIVEGGGRGYSNEALTAMRTSARDTIAQEFQGAQQALQQREAIYGDRDLPSGVSAMRRAALATEGARAQAGAQNEITMENERVRQDNYWRALGVLSGNAAQMDPLGFAGAVNQGQSAQAQLGQAYASAKQAEGQGFWGSLKRSLGEGLGSFLSGKGMDKLFGGGK